MNKERLKTLANHLRTVKPQNFDLYYWSCGTTACAVGHACTIKEFQDAGLSLRNDFDPPTPTFKEGNLGWEAVESFFDISRDEAKTFFSVDEYPTELRTPTGVADRIEEFLTRFAC